MRLLIDIPEDLYNKLVKNKEFYPTTTMIYAIANGTPYEDKPQNDLISREDLKEHKLVVTEFVQLGGRTNGKTLESINKAYQQGWNDCIDAIIDNAPTVSDRYNEGYAQGYKDGMKGADMRGKDHE